MDFRKKIDTILKANKLGINSPSGLESYVKAGRGAISGPYKNNETPGLATVKKIVDTLRVNSQWWETGKGSVFADEIDGVNEPPLKYETLDDLRKNLEDLRKNLEDLRKNLDD